MISLSSKTAEESLLLVIRIGWLGNLLPVLKGVYWRLKDPLNLLAFSLKCDTSLPSMKRGGKTGIFLPLKNIFSIDQQVFPFVWRSLNFREILRNNWR